MNPSGKPSEDVCWVPLSNDPLSATWSLMTFKAYNSGASDALRSLPAYLGQVISLDEFRARLRRQMAAANLEPGADLSLANARFFAARGHGFESWEGSPNSLNCRPEQVKAEPEER